MSKRFLALYAAIAATTLLSCSKSNPTEGETSFLVSNQKIEGASDVGKWGPDHSISLFGNNSNLEFKVVEYSASLYKVSGPHLDDAGEVAAFSPYSQANTYDGTCIEFPMPAEMDGRQGDVSGNGIPAFGIYNADDETLELNNAFGLLKLTFEGDKYMEYFTLTAADAKLNGQFRLNVSTGSIESLDGTDAIRINTRMQLSDTPVSYYLALPAAEYSNMSVSIFGNDGTSEEIALEGPIRISTSEVAEYKDLLAFYGNTDRTIRLDEDGRANCYMIAAPGTYVFNGMYKGNSDEFVRDPESVELLWEDVTGFIESLVLEDDDIKFTTSRTEAANALVAIKDTEGTILWSWHIWHTGSALPEAESYQNHEGQSFEVLDRDLGSWSPTSQESVHYQWGRKDPIPNHSIYDKDGKEIVWNTSVPSEIPGNFFGPIPGNQYGYLETGVSHPMAFITYAETAKYVDDWLLDGDHGLWGDPEDKSTGEEYGWSGEKTMYDPCPAGYRVAGKNTWTGFTSNGQNVGELKDFNIVGEFNHGWHFKKTPDDQTGSFYPSTGFRYLSDGRLSPPNILGICWSSTAIGERTSALFQNDVLVFPLWQDYGRAWAAGVRCVKE